MQPLNKFDSLWHLLTEGTPDVVMNYIENGSKIDLHDKNNNTVIFDANSELIPLLVQGGVDINHTNVYGKNALFDADFTRSKILIENGINIHQLTKENENALFYWKDDRRGEYDKFKLLIEKGINHNQINIYNEHVLFVANSWLTDVLLFDKGVDFDVNQLSSDGEHCMARYFDNDLYQKLFLLVKAGFNTDYIDFSCETIKNSTYYDFFLNKKLETEALKEKQLLNKVIEQYSETPVHIKKRI